ncbi:MAG: hypothetical protein IJ906_04450 [Oscillospiraceae bacterium]|nr:hypothetical protein [Oscillospiraceae bacterium]
MSHFTVEEAIRIKEQWFNDIPIEKLFQKNRGEDNDRDNQTDGKHMNEVRRNPLHERVDADIQK